MIITIIEHLSCFWQDISVNINKMYNPFLQKVYFFQGKKSKTFPLDLSSPYISSHEATNSTRMDNLLT